MPFELSRRVDLSNGKYQFSRGFCKNCQGYTFCLGYQFVISNLYNIFMLKCVSVTNISIEHYMKGVIE